MAAAQRRVSALDEDEFYPHSLQEELNEILEAFYEAVSEEDIIAYQQFVEGIQNMKIAEQAVKVHEKAPDFTLEDQDGDQVCLSQLLKDGPVVLIFYRGKWCPHCNAYIMRLQRNLEKIKATGASLLAISPMLPDGTKYLATKRCLEFSVLSDVGNTVAHDYNLTFQVKSEYREKFLNWGEDVPSHNGDESWEIPLPATYIIDPDGTIVWSFIDNDPGARADMDEILDAIPMCAVEDLDEDQRRRKEGFSGESDGKGGMGRPLRHSLSSLPRHRDKGGDVERPLRHSIAGAPTRRITSTFRRSFKQVFGKKRQSAKEYLGHYLK